MKKERYPQYLYETSQKKSKFNSLQSRKNRCSCAPRTICTQKMQLVSLCTPTPFFFHFTDTQSFLKWLLFYSDDSRRPHRDLGARFPQRRRRRPRRRRPRPRSTTTTWPNFCTLCHKLQFYFILFLFLFFIFLGGSTLG